jgi:hypothetical protein
MKKLRKYAPDPNGMRHAIRLGLLVLFAKGKHGTVSEVLDTIEIGVGYNPNTAKVQVAQVRKVLLAELKVNTGQVKGRLTAAQIEAIERQLGKLPVKARIRELRDDARKVYRKAA